MKTTITREPFDYDACKKRLRTVTTDAAILDSLDRVVEGELGQMGSDRCKLVLYMRLLRQVWICLDRLPEYSPVEVSVLDNCKHAPHIEQPEAILSVIAEFTAHLENIEAAQVSMQ